MHLIRETQMKVVNSKQSVMVRCYEQKWKKMDYSTSEFVGFCLIS